MIAAFYFLSGGLAVYAISMTMFRTYLKRISLRFQAYEHRIEKKRQEIERKTKALQLIIDRVNHDGLKPRVARLMGLIPLVLHATQEARINILLAKKPNHHRYAELAEMYLNDLDEIIQHINIVSRELHEYMGEAVKEFEHLQD
ncbi:MAG TPA: hypothetical protein VIM65_07780 [Cyclobacteriaceae bacterium]